MTEIKERGEVVSIRQESNRDMIITIKVPCPSEYFEHHFGFGRRITIIQDEK